MNKIKMNKIKYHIAFDLLITWSILIVGVYFGNKYSVLPIILVCEAPIWVAYLPRTLQWICIGLACTFSTPKTIQTKGFRLAYREGAYLFNSKTKWKYSVIKFNDPNLKGNYIFIGEALGFKTGDSLKIVYYPLVKYIMSIDLND